MKTVTKKIITFIIAGILVLGLTPLFACSETTAYAEDFMASLKISQNDDVPLTGIYKDGNDLYYLVFKVGEAEQAFVQTVTMPIQKHSAEIEREFTISEITGETISSGISKSISTSKTRTVTAAESASLSSTLGSSLGISLSTSEKISATAGIKAGVANASSTAEASFSQQISATISASISGTYATNQSVSDTSATTESFNESYEVEKTLQSQIGSSIKYDSSKFTDNLYYAYCLIEYYQMYQTFVYDAGEGKILSNYLTALTSDPAIQLRSSETPRFSVPEDSPKFIKIDQNALSSDIINQIINAAGTKIETINEDTHGTLKGFLPQKLLAYKPLCPDPFLTDSSSYSIYNKATTRQEFFSSPIYGSYLHLSAKGLGDNNYNQNFGGIYVNLPTSYPSTEKVYYVIVLAKAEKGYMVLPGFNNGNLLESIEYLSSSDGNGLWKWYVCKMTFKSPTSFTTILINRTNASITSLPQWDIGYYNVFEADKSDVQLTKYDVLLMNNYIPEN